jgi:hypothetical protein
MSEVHCAMAPTAPGKPEPNGVEQNSSTANEDSTIAGTAAR